MAGDNTAMAMCPNEHAEYSELQFKILDEVQTPIWVLQAGVHNEVLWNNRAFLETFGKTQEMVDSRDWHPPMPPSLKVKHQQIHGEVCLHTRGEGSPVSNGADGEASTSSGALISESGLIPGPNGTVLMYDLHMSGIILRRADGKVMDATLVQAHKYSVQETAAAKRDGGGASASSGDAENNRKLAGGPAAIHETDLLKMMHMHSPIFILLFTGDGKLLKANPSAVSYFGSDNFELEKLFAPGRLWFILREREDPIPFESADRRADVMREIYSSIKRKEHVRVQQLTESRKHPGQLRWSELEMWPLEDPVDGGNAVLVNQTNITRLKETENKLRDAHKELFNLNYELKMELAVAKEELAAASKDTHITLDVVTPVDKALALLDGMLDGNIPSMQEVERLQHTLATAHNLREPVGLSDQLKELVKHQRLDNDVAGALGELLQGRKMDSSAMHSLGQRGLDDITSHPVLLNRPAVSVTDEGMQLRPVLRPINTAEALPPDVLCQLVAHVRAHGNPPEGRHSDLVRILLGAETWAWDPWELHEATSGHPLSTLTFWLFARHGLLGSFEIDETKLMSFLQQVEAGYRDNLYHNRTHAADVVQTMNIVMSQGGPMHAIVGEMELMAGLLAAAVHDFEHKGLDNNYLIRNQDPLAILYNDRSPMENHHLSGAFRLLSVPECAFLERVSADQFSLLRQLMIDMVLATDMKNHFQILSQFQSRLEKRFLERTDKSVLRRRSSLSGISEVDSLEEDWVPEESDKSLALQVALKIADVGHLMAKEDVHRRWVARLEEEFFLQGDKERSQSLQCSFLMDREKPGVSKSQVGFFDIVVFPLIRSWCNVFPRSQGLAEMVEANYALWKSLDEASKSAEEGAAAAAEGGGGGK